MNRTLSVRSAFFCGSALLLSVALEGRDLPRRASLARLSHVGEIVIYSARSPEDESALREAVERRLERAGITTDPSLDTSLAVSLHPTIKTAQSGQKHFHYTITLAFREPVRSERMPDSVFRATTWSGSAVLSRFDEDVSLQVLVGAVQFRLQDFIMTVSTDTQGARGNQVDQGMD